VNPVVRGALLLFVFSIPFEMPKRAFPVEVPMMAALLFLLTTLLQPRAAWSRMPAALPWFAAFLWVTTIAMVVNRVEFVQRAVVHLGSMTIMLALFWAMTNVLRDRAVLRGVLVAVVAACALRAAMQILGIGVTSHTVWTGGERLSVFGQNANLAAIILSIGVAVSVGLALSPSDWLPRPGPFVVPLAGMMAWAVIDSGSRGGTLCTVLALGVYLMSGRRVGTRIRNIVLGLLALGAVGFGVTRSEMMRARFAQAAEQGNLAGRERIYPAVLDMIRERPLLGWGPVDNQFEIARRIRERRKPSRDAHNLVGELLTSAGLLGAAPFLVGFVICLRSGWRSRHGAMGFLPVAMLAAVLMGTASGTWLASNILWFTLAVAVAAGTRWANPASQQAWSDDPCAD